MFDSTKVARGFVIMTILQAFGKSGSRFLCLIVVDKSDGVTCVVGPLVFPIKMTM